jgi:hypothetical protein
MSKMSRDDVDGIATLLELLRPSPSPFPLTRLGGTTDGAYLVPEDLDGVTACFSPGVANRKGFEDELAERYGIRSHMCDASSDESALRTPLITGLQTFEKKWLDVDGGDLSMTLEQWVDAWAADGEDLMLQMDIEGAEYRNILATPLDVLKRFRIMVMELHSLGNIHKPKDRAERFEPFLRRLTANHTVVHAHPNNCCGEVMLDGTEMNIPRVIEVTLLRNDRFLGDEARWITPQLPHPSDIDRNVTGKAPILLNNAWRHVAEPASTSLRMFQQYAHYAEARLASVEAEQDRATDLIWSAWLRREQALSGSGLQDDSVGLWDLVAAKPFFVSSRHQSDPGLHVVQDRAPFFFHTRSDDETRITVNMGSRCEVASVTLGNRTDVRQDRGKHLLYAVHDSMEDWRDRLRPLSLTAAFFSRPPQTSTTAVPGSVGRYLSIVSPHRVPLHLSTLVVLGRSFVG